MRLNSRSEVAVTKPNSEQKPPRIDLLFRMEFSIAVFQVLQGSSRKSRAIQCYNDLDGKLAEKLTAYWKILIWLKTNSAMVKALIR